MKKTIKILIADDHQIVRMGLASVFRKERDLVVAGEAKNGIEAVAKARELKPDVILMDLMMPKMNGEKATREILAENPDVKILVLTTFGAAGEVRRALDAGAAGALVKDTLYNQIISAIRDVADGQRVISPEIQHNLDLHTTQPSLSPRQTEILMHVANGKTTKEISDIVGIGPDGVNAHLRAIFARLGAASRAEAVSIALREHLVDL